MTTNATAERKLELLTEQAERLRHPARMVETGLYHGYGSGMSLLDDGTVDEYVAIDCQRENVELARERGYLARLGDSGELLREVIAEWDTPGIVWLDAHGIPGHEPDINFPICPLIAELCSLIACPVVHRVLIDDLHMFDSMHKEHDWPSLEVVRSLVDYSGRWTRREESAVMILEPIMKR